MKRSSLCKTTAVAGLLAALLIPSVVQAQRVNMATLNWAPFYAEDLPRNGFFTALVRAAFEEAGHQTTTEFMPWARAKLEVEQGDREVLLGAYYNEQRAKTYHASESIYTTGVGLVALEGLGIQSFESLRDLSGYTIGYGRGFTVSEEFDNADYLNKEAEEDLALNVRKLYAGRIDLVAGSFENIRYIAQQEGKDVDELVFLDPALKESSLHIMVSRAVPDGKNLLDQFHNGLATIRSNGTYDRILEEMGYK
jgi:polar amino acid transport system substrate-binding protein